MAKHLLDLNASSFTMTPVKVCGCHCSLSKFVFVALRSGQLCSLILLFFLYFFVVCLHTTNSRGNMHLSGLIYPQGKIMSWRSTIHLRYISWLLNRIIQNVEYITYCLYQNVLAAFTSYLFQFQIFRIHPCHQILKGKHFLLCWEHITGTWIVDKFSPDFQCLNHLCATPDLFTLCWLSIVIVERVEADILLYAVLWNSFLLKER